MKAPVNNDNLYKVGTVIYARQRPTVKLIIMSYKARIYYCEISGADRKTIMPYFERELFVPVGTSKYQHLDETGCN